MKGICSCYSYFRILIQLRFGYVEIIYAISKDFKSSVFLSKSYFNIASILIQFSEKSKILKFKL